MWISEVFHSVQGEGQFVGVESAFIRTSGCNLRCHFCDTPYTSWNPAGVERSLDSLVSEIDSYNCEHVVITGGEPMLVPDLVPLTSSLSANQHLITIETAGTAFQEVACDLMSISPKLQNSVPVGTDWEQRHQDRRHRPDVIAQLIEAYPYQFKFVVDQPEDIEEVEAYLSEFPQIDQKHVYLMPQGVDHEQLAMKMPWIEETAENRGWQVSPRLHIELFGNTPGT